MFAKGSKNPNWAGGVSAYPNHGELKRNRLVVLNLHKWKCEICGERAHNTHHIDQKRDNHSLSNLKAVCKECHKKVHREIPPPIDRIPIDKHLTANKLFRLRGRTPLKIQRFMLSYGEELSRLYSEELSHDLS